MKLEEIEMTQVPLVGPPTMITATTFSPELSMPEMETLDLELRRRKWKWVGIGMEAKCLS